MVCVGLHLLWNRGQGLSLGDLVKTKRVLARPWAARSGGDAYRTRSSVQWEVFAASPLPAFVPPPLLAPPLTLVPSRGSSACTLFPGIRERQRQEGMK